MHSFNICFVQIVSVNVETIVGLIAILISIIGAIISLWSRISILETNQKNIEDAFKFHEAMNEKSFSKIESELKDINEKLNMLIGYLEAKEIKKKL